MSTSFSNICHSSRFGAGPHYVSIIVDLDDDDDDNNEQPKGTTSSSNTHHQIILQLAPLSQMPHSIHLFLTQISEGYWSRGTPAIILNAGHVLQACPHPCLETSSLPGQYVDDPYLDMRASGLDSVSFQEYNARYPHEKYTVGFAGRPHSGPEFYINLLNNTLDHGPVDQLKKELGVDFDRVDGRGNSLGEELVDENGKVVIMEPDPCFGRVVEGFDVVDKIAGRITRASLPRDAKERRTRGDVEDDDGGEEEEGDYEDDYADEAFDDTLLIRPVRIVSMSIMESYGGPKNERKKGARKEQATGTSDGREEL